LTDSLSGGNHSTWANQPHARSQGGSRSFSPPPLDHPDRIHRQPSRAVPWFLLQTRQVRSVPCASRDRRRGDELATPRQYQELVGCLLWLAGCSRPDVCFAASYLTRYMSSPSEHHCRLALRVVSYLVHTRTLGITLGATSYRSLETFCDADWGGCLSTRRSTTGHVSYLSGSPIN